MGHQLFYRHMMHLLLLYLDYEDVLFYRYHTGDYRVDWFQLLALRSLSLRCFLISTYNIHYQTTHVNYIVIDSTYHDPLLEGNLEGMEGEGSYHI